MSEQMEDTNDELEGDDTETEEELGDGAREPGSTPTPGRFNSGA